MAQEKTQMNGGRGLNQGGSEEINCSETNGAVPKGGMAPFVLEIGMIGIVVLFLPQLAEIKTP